MRIPAETSPMAQTMLFDTLYRFAASKNEAGLFGNSMPGAREAFVRSLPGGLMPILWFEIPLTGEPRFDLHLAYGNEEIHAHAPFSPGAAGPLGSLLNWYASAPRVGGGLALAYDLQEGRTADPAVHINVKGADSFPFEDFFSCLERPDAGPLCADFVKRLPSGWRIWYFGLHPGRPGAPVRIDCFVDPRLWNTYSENPEKFKEDLRRAGFLPAGEDLMRIVRQIASSPFSPELQFDVLRDGSTGPTLGISAGMPPVPSSAAREQWKDDGPAGRLMAFAVQIGAADERWRLLSDSFFSTITNPGGNITALYCIPTFIKFRLRDGAALDAKVYLQSGALPVAMSPLASDSPTGRA